jgi:dihydroorotate dehydrogenase
MILIGRILGSNFIFRGLTALLFSYSNRKLEQEILGIKFKNPVGLAAGFDKDAYLTNILPSVGFGFVEVGSITAEPCAGNPGKRLWRLKKTRGLVVNYGLKNQGSERIKSRLANKKFKVPVGTSIAPTNCVANAETDAAIADYAKTYKEFSNIGDYFTINISCPNSFGGQSFTDPAKLEKLLFKLDKIKTSKPVFIKLSPDLEKNQIDEILEVVEQHKIDGIICSNLTKKRNNGKIIVDSEIPEQGGISGKVVEDLANSLIECIRQKTGNRYVIVGCGGVFSAEDAYKKIKAGASLVQMITGMIFEGPQIISEINRGLVKLLEKDGFKNISEAVGKELS